MKSNSLRQQLLWWLLPASVAILIGSVFVAFLIAARVVGEGFDEGLRDAAEILAERIRTNPYRVRPELPAAAERMVMADAEDRLWFKLSTADGQILAGDPALMPDTVPLTRDEVRFYDAKIADKPVRVIQMSFEIEQQRLSILIAATMHKRDDLIRDILLGISIPEVALAFAMVVLVQIGIKRGLAPLARLRQELADRSHLDLRPVGLEHVPDDLRPVVGEINQLLLRLETATAAQSAFVSDAAHQLRTPIAALQTQAEILLRESPDAQRSERLFSLVQSTRRLAHLAHQLLSLARAEPALKQTAPVDIAEIVREIADSLYPQAIERDLDLGFDLEPATVFGSAVTLREMIVNLVDNAIRYTPSPGTITVRTRHSTSEVVLDVDDSGPGIPEAERERVFERFHRLANDREEGSGLGLAIVSEVARQHGGSVSVHRSQTLGGALFEVRLPAA